MNHCVNHVFRNKRRAFSLVELIFVIAILAILMGFGASGLKNVFVASGVSDAMGMVGGQIKLAHQMASVKNREVEVRFYQLPSDTGGPTAIRAMQIVLREAEMDPGDNNYTTPGTASFNPKVRAVDRIRRFPAGVVVVDDRVKSSLTSETSRKKGAKTVLLWKTTAAEYSYIRLKPDGSTDLDLNKNWYFTLALETEVERGEMKNFATLEMDPGNGKITWLRP
ncbi:MAG: Verru_Chthon cassette protein D [Verrucomicrobiales bacterium]|nr:Verru_Chthon cassette protein D [Verrucomicrobiales bacterium]